MSKLYFRRGSFLNQYKSLAPVCDWANSCGFDSSKHSKSFASIGHTKFGKDSDFIKVLIIRGIGYRAFSTLNDMLSADTVAAKYTSAVRPTYTNTEGSEWVNLEQSSKIEFSNDKYLLVRAGHTTDLWMPLHHKLRSRNLKKDRKLVLSSRYKTLVADFAKVAWLYRKPSVYTGRGIRFKHLKHVRKAGKKDKQKGKAF